MKKVLLVCLLASFVIGGCKKSTTPTPPVVTSNYQPTTSGSTWIYETTNNNTTPATKTSFAVNATAKDSSINGKSYRVFTNTSGGNDYYFKDGDNYYQFGGIAGITDNTELLFLKASVAAAATWEENKTVNIPQIGLATLKVKYTMVEKKASMTVEGKAYADVLDVKIELLDVKVSGIPITITLQDIHFFYAAAVGRIKSQIKLTITPPIGSQLKTDNETNLKSSVIVP